MLVKSIKLLTTKKTLTMSDTKTHAYTKSVINLYKCIKLLTVSWQKKNNNDAKNYKF